MRKQHNVKSSFSRSYLPPEVAEFIKPSRVKHFYGKTRLSSKQQHDVDESGIIPVFHKRNHVVA